MKKTHITYNSCTHFGLLTVSFHLEILLFVAKFSPTHALLKRDVLPKLHSLHKIK